MSDPDVISPERYMLQTVKVQHCPECGSRDLSEPDEEGLIDCLNCGIWFKPEHPDNVAAYRPVAESGPDDHLERYINQLHPRVIPQLEHRGFRKRHALIWDRNLFPNWLFEVIFDVDPQDRTMERMFGAEAAHVWLGQFMLRVTAVHDWQVYHYAVYANIPALIYDLDRLLAALEGKRMIGKDDHGVPVIEAAASIPLALGLLEDEQSDLPFQPALPASPKPGQGPDDIDPQAYLDKLPDMFGERRIRISYYEWWWPVEGDDNYEEEHGWENEEGEDLSLDQFDVDDDISIVDKTVKYLQDKGASDTGNADWYSSEADTDMYTGHTKELSYHLYGYTDEELAQIYARIVRPRHRGVQEASDPDDPEALLQRVLADKPNADEVKTLSIVGRRWFQRTYGNTYHSVSIEVNGKRVADLPRAYGYGEQYLWRAWEWLMDNNYVYPEISEL